MKHSLVVFAVIAAALINPALAQKDDKPGRGGPPDKAATQGRGHGNDNPGQNQGQDGGRGNSQAAAPGNIVIADRDRNAVYDYYRGQVATGSCPPGLAKKNNGCLPPGQAKKQWTVGQPPPGSVVFHPLPGSLLGQLTPAPAGYQYGRVDSDVVMMATGTRMVVNAIADLTAM